MIAGAEAEEKVARFDRERLAHFRGREVAKSKTHHQQQFG